MARRQGPRRLPEFAAAPDQDRHQHLLPAGRHGHLAAQRGRCPVGARHPDSFFLAQQIWQLLRDAMWDVTPPAPVQPSDLYPLKSGDFVFVECGACSHDGLIHPAALPSLGLRPDERITDLAPLPRMRREGESGRLNQMGALNRRHAKCEAPRHLHRRRAIPVYWKARNLDSSPPRFSNSAACVCSRPKLADCRYGLRGIFFRTLFQVPHSDREEIIR